MTDDASVEAAGEDASGPFPPARDVPQFAIRKVPPPTAAERQARRDAMDRAIRFGATPYRDGEGKARYVFFKEANDAPVEAWRRDPRAKRNFRKTQQARKAAGQLIWHPEDQIELAKRLGVIYHREGRSAEGAAERGLYDAIWRYEHVWDTFTTPRRIGPIIIDTGRIAAVAEEEVRKLQAEDPKARSGFFVRDRKNNGLIYVVPNPEPEVALEGSDELVLLGRSEAATGLVPKSETLIQATWSDAEQPLSIQEEEGHGRYESGAERARDNVATISEDYSAKEDAPTGREVASPFLHYPDISLGKDLGDVSENPSQGGDASAAPVVNLSGDRRRAILNNEPAVFEIADSPDISGKEPWYAVHQAGYLAVLLYSDIIEYEARRQGIDPDLVKAMVYTENANGALYGPAAQAAHLERSTLPMNIRSNLWSGLAGENADLRDPFQNIEAGIRLLGRITDRLKDPSVAKVATLYNSLAKEQVTELGARVAEVYETRAWEKVPRGIAPRTRAAIERRRRSLNKRLELD